MVLEEKRYHKWKIGQINIQTCSDDTKLDFALQECQRANLDVVCFQEVRRLSSGSLHHLGYDFFWNGLNRFKRSGVGIAIRDNSYFHIDSIINCSERLIGADITVRGCKLRVISAYAPTLDSALSSKQLFYRELSKLCKTEQNRKVLIQGDFNMEMPLCRENSCFDATRSYENGTNQSNENAMLFLTYATNNELSILNTWYTHPICHRVTWHHPNGTTKKVYDYSLSGPWLRQFVTNVRVRNSYFNSDHRLLVTSLNTPANRAARTFRRRKTVPKHNFELLNNSEVHCRSCDAIENYVSNTETPTAINDLHDYIVQAIERAKKNDSNGDQTKSYNSMGTRQYSYRTTYKKTACTQTS